jgi:DNA-binding transcriptional LysR family regulator
VGIQSEVAHSGASTPVARDQLIVVAGPEHPWIGRTRLARGDLKKGEWVLREPGSGTRSVFEEAMANLGVDYRALRICLELPSNEAVRAAVEAGLGATAISASVAAPSIEAGLLHQVRFRLPEREFCVLRHRERYQSRAANALLALMTASSERARGRQRTFAYLSLCAFGGHQIIDDRGDVCGGHRSLVNFDHLVDDRGPGGL